MLGNSPMRPCRAISKVLTTALVVAAWLACLPDVRAQAPKEDVQKPNATLGDVKRDDPQARALFDEVAKAYRSLKSYSDQGGFTVAMKIGGRLQKHELPLKLTLVRPNKLDFDGGPVRIKSDGTTMTTTVVPLKRYTTSPAPEKIGFETFSDGPSGAVLFGGPSGPPMFVLLNLVTGADASAAVGLLGGSLQAAPADPQSTTGKVGAKTSAILVDLPEGQPDILLTIDPVTKLLSAIDMLVGPELLAQAGGPALAVDRVERFGWSSGPVSTAVAPDRSFAFEAPKDYAKVEDLLKRDENGPNATKIGKPAPDFTLTVLDGPAKTRTITKAELAGKVVVIDFWATWCQPCMKELPEIQQVIENYTASKKGLVIVAVSQDDEPAELSAVRKRVEKTLAEKQIKLENGAVGLVALDPSKSVGGAFEIEGYPTLIILDGKGVVQAVHVGFDPNGNEPFSKTLSKEIDALLEGRSLAAPKEKAAQPALQKQAKTPD